MNIPKKLNLKDRYQNGKDNIVKNDAVQSSKKIDEMKLVTYSTHEKTMILFNPKITASVCFDVILSPSKSGKVVNK